MFIITIISELASTIYFKELAGNGMSSFTIFHRTVNVFTNDIQMLIATVCLEFTIAKFKMHTLP